MIGRERELAQVTASLDAARSGMHALLLQGEAGIGKTTIWQAAQDTAVSRGYRVVVTRPTEAEARIPFAGLNDLFGDLVDAGRPALPAPQRAALEGALMRADVDGEPMQPLAISLAVLELLRSASSVQPLAVAIDDAQWLDESSAGVLRFALRRLETERVVLIATERTRPDAAAATIVGDLTPARLTRVVLRGLTVEAVDRLLDESFGLRLAPTLLRRVHRLSGGNPFYAMEIGRALQARGVDQPTGTIPLPDSLTALLRERLGALSPEAHDVVVHAAALSQPTVAVIEAALGPDRVASGLAAAVESAVLVTQGDAVRFAHPMLAAEALAALDEADRRALHRRLAGAVSEPEELARHLALGSTGPHAEVASALDAAAAHALGRGAPDASAELSELAAMLTPEADPSRARRMAAAGRGRLMAGDVGRARQLLERALDEPAAASGPPRAELLFQLAGVRQLLDDFTAAAELGREALDHAADDTELAIQIKLLLAGVAFITGRDWSSGARHAFESKDLAERLDDPRILAATLGPCLSWCYATGRGYHRDLAERAAELEPWTRRFRTLDLPAFDIGNIEFAEGETASAIARHRALLDRAERDGDYSSLPFLLGNIALLDFLEGERGIALARVAQARRLSEATEQRTAQVHTLVCEARLLARLGDADRALTAGSEALQLMEATSWRVGEWWMRGDLALLQLSRGNPEAALELVAGAADPADDDGPERWRWAQAVAVDALVALGRLDDARSTLASFEAHARARGAAPKLAEAARARARVLAAAGDLDGADAAAAEAEALHRTIEDRWELARTLLVVGEVHRRARRRARARAALREALEIFTFLGANRWSAHAQDALRRIGASREGDGLTPTQRRVAELVASGLTNRQTADRLSMSPHTVEAHLSAIYRALGIRSRAELAPALGDDHPRDSDAGSRDSAAS